VFEDNVTFIAIGIVVLIAMAGIAIYASTRKPVYRRKGQLLLLNEQRFLVALLQALPSDTILTFKVRLLDIVTAVNAKSGKAMDDILADYCVDFVLVDRNTTDVRLCIEMDMESQDASERLNKNTHISRALRRAGVPHIRLPLVRFYDAVRVRQVIREALAANPMPKPDFQKTPPRS
jgi:uncharacterized protein DUF2726